MKRTGGGGPATPGVAWLTEFIAWCHRNGVRLDDVYLVALSDF